MPNAVIDGIDTYYEVMGFGTPLLLFAPGGFDATMDKWREATAWKGMDALGAFAAQHQVIVYDRRECGQSGGRVERLSWASYTRQAAALLDHLKIDSAYVLGGCMGCSVALGVRRSLSGARARALAPLARRRLPLEDRRAEPLSAPL